MFSNFSLRSHLLRNYFSVLSDLTTRPVQRQQAGSRLQQGSLYRVTSEENTSCSPTSTNKQNQTNQKPATHHNNENKPLFLPSHHGFTDKGANANITSLKAQNYIQKRVLGVKSLLLQHFPRHRSELWITTDATRPSRQPKLLESELKTEISSKGTVYVLFAYKKLRLKKNKSWNEIDC